MNKSHDRLKRYNLVLPEEMFSEVKRVADEQQTSVAEVIRKFIKLGLMVIEIQETTGLTLVVKKEDEEQKIIVL
jgi:hypothetical protein